MKYSIERKADGRIIETLSVGGYIVQKNWHREEDGNIAGLVTKSKDFAEQLEGYMDEDTLYHINDLFDNSFLPADIDDFIINTGLY